MPFVHGGKAALCQSLRTPVSWTVVKQKRCFPTLGNCARTCWQLPALASDHSSEPCHRFVPDPTAAPTPQSTPAATLKMALSALEISPGQLAPHHREQECCQASYVLGQSHFGHRQGSRTWRGLTSCQLPGEPLNPTGGSWQRGLLKLAVADDVPHSNCRGTMNSEQETSKNIP